MVTKTNLKKEEDEKCLLSKNDLVGANFWKGICTDMLGVSFTLRLYLSVIAQRYPQLYLNAFKVVTTTCTLHSCAGLLFLDEDRTSTIIFSNCPKHYFSKPMGNGGWGGGGGGGGGGAGGGGGEARWLTFQTTISTIYLQL